MTNRRKGGVVMLYNLFSISMLAVIS